MLATTVAWDDSLSWTWERAIDALQTTMAQVCVGTACCVIVLLLVTN